MTENQNIEYKESWRDELFKWIYGCANTKGGTVIIGKDDNGNAVGLSGVKKLMEMETELLLKQRISEKSKKVSCRLMLRTIR